MLDCGSYALVAADVSGSSIVMWGANQGTFLTAAGMTRTWMRDERVLHRYTAWLERGGSTVVAGVHIQLVAPSGVWGDDWLEILHDDIQSGAHLVAIPRPMRVSFGMGVLVTIGSGIVGDLVRMRAEYEGGGR
jgi:hypothetical protein